MDNKKINIFNVNDLEIPYVNNKNDISEDIHKYNNSLCILKNKKEGISSFLLNEIPTLDEIKFLKYILSKIDEQSNDKSQVEFVVNISEYGYYSHKFKRIRDCLGSYNLDVWDKVHLTTSLYFSASGKRSKDGKDWIFDIYIPKIFYCSKESSFES